MIGTLERLAGELAIIDVGGMGYRLKVPISTSQELRVGRTVKLYVTHRFAQDVFHLYGFSTREEREIFERVCAVTGVGPAIALAILSSLSIDRFRDVVLRGESKALEKIRGVGKKTAQRLILELRGALEEEDLRATPPGPVEGPAEDAVKALLSLGFGAVDAEARVRRALESAPAEAAVAELVRRASRG